VSARREFSRAVKVAVIRRATENGVTFCEGCGALAKKWQIDHKRADGLLGEPTIENAQLLGSCFYGAKNAEDTAFVAEAKRREAAELIGRSGKRRIWWRSGRDQRLPLKVAAGVPRLAREGFVPAGRER
jgi:hypothetical protein